MIGFVIRRLLSMIGVLLAISVCTFLIFEVIPDGDPAVRLAGRQATPQEIQSIRAEWGFTKPVYVQYLDTMTKVLDGSVISYVQQTNVEAEIVARLSVTLSLAAGAGAIWLIFGLAFGVLSATRAGRLLDRVLTVGAMVGVSTPVFLLGTVMLFYLGYKLQWLPLGGYVSLAVSPWRWFTHMLMPWLALAVGYVGIYSRVLRSTILDLLHEDFVRTCRAKGLSERQIIMRHVLRNSLIPIVSLFGLDLAIVVGGGAILTESVFNLPGVGQYAAQSIGQLDVPPVLVITMLGAAAVVVLGAVVDLIYVALDPRIRLGR